MPMFKPPSPIPLFDTEKEFRAWMDEQDRRYERARVKSCILIVLCIIGLFACLTQVRIVDKPTTGIEDGQADES